MTEIRDPRTYAIIGAAMEVHSQLGCGFLEHVYHEALMIEMEERKIPFQYEVLLPIYYKGRQLSRTYRADFICYDEVIVEVKALKMISGIEEAQILNYLTATNHPIGLILNFGNTSLEYKRYASPKKKSDKSS